MVDMLSGKLLIADPFLRDPNFMRSVVFICEHKDEGSFGFVLNRRYEQLLGELIAGIETCEFPVYYGGPVQVDTIHYLHQRPDLITGGVEVIDGIVWGGDFEKIIDLLKANKLSERDIRFLLAIAAGAKASLKKK